MPRHVHSLALVALAGLAACGGEVTVTPTPDPAEARYDALRDETLALRRDLAGVPVTPDAQLPLSGTTTYTGTAVLDLNTARDTSLIGDSRVVANFGSDQVFGRFDNFVGTLAGGQIRNYDGFLSTTNGEIDVNQVNAIRAEVGGVIQGGGNVIGVDGTLIGNFLGPRDPRYPEGLVAEDGVGTDFTLNGAPIAGGLSVLGRDVE